MYDRLRAVKIKVYYKDAGNAIAGSVSFALTRIIFLICYSVPSAGGLLIDIGLKDEFCSYKEELFYV